MARKLFCIMSPNGAGKTTITKALIEKHLWLKAKIFENQIWNVIAQEPVNGNKRTRVLIIGHYGNGAIGGADLLRKEAFWRALEAAVAYPGAENIYVEARKFGGTKVFQKLRVYCIDNNIEFFAIYVAADPVTCYNRVMERPHDIKYDLQYIMSQFPMTKYLWMCIPDKHRIQLKNIGRTAEETAAKLSKLIFT